MTRSPATAVVEVQITKEIKAAGQSPQVPADEDAARTSACLDLKCIDGVKTHVSSLTSGNVLSILDASTSEGVVISTEHILRDVQLASSLGKATLTCDMRQQVIAALFSFTIQQDKTLCLRAGGNKTLLMSTLTAWFYSSVWQLSLSSTSQSGYTIYPGHAIQALNELNFTVRLHHLPGSCNTGSH
jgi:hypothetical protein